MTPFAAGSRPAELKGQRALTLNPRELLSKKGRDVCCGSQNKGGGLMKNVSKYEMACLSDEKERLRDEARNCDFCSTSVAEHNRCYAETARASGRRSQVCFG
jgi:hypothetical protein